MEDKQSKFWKDATKFDSFELRKHRFRDELLPVFYGYLGINENSYVLDAGCGTGVFGRYLAKNLINGRIEGFDISTAFIKYGKTKIEELGLENKMNIEVQDGYKLTFDDNTFDAVTNYTYLGCLSDPYKGAKELIRVCKIGGTISSVVATNQILPVHWCGDYTFDGAKELSTILSEENEIFHNKVNKRKPLSDKEKYHEFRYPKMFKELGLSDIHLYPFAHALCYNDDYFDKEYRKELILNETKDNLNWYISRYKDNKTIYNQYGFTDIKIKKLEELTLRKIKYIQSNFDEDESYEWFGNMNFIVTGKKDI